MGLGNCHNRASGLPRWISSRKAEAQPPKALCNPRVSLWSDSAFVDNTELLDGKLRLGRDRALRPQKVAKQNLPGVSKIAHLLEGNGCPVRLLTRNKSAANGRPSEGNPKFDSLPFTVDHPSETAGN